MRRVPSGRRGGGPLPPALLVPLLLLARTASGDDLETVRLAALRLFAWPAAAELPAVAREAAALAAALNASYQWPDLNYTDAQDRADWSAFNHLGRVVTLAQAYATPGSPSFEQAALAAPLHGALAVWISCRFDGSGPPCLVNSNWWYQWIGGMYRNENPKPTSARRPSPTQLTPGPPSPTNPSQRRCRLARSFCCWARTARTPRSRSR